MFSKTQTVYGINSKLDEKEDSHILLFDIEDCTLKECEKTLLNVQIQHDLSNIFIVSDKPNSFRAYCFSQRTFREYLKILLATEHLCYNFFYWTVFRGKATLRTSGKKDRPKQKLVSVLPSYSVPIPKNFQGIKYDTGLVKMGIFKQVNIFDKQ
jgi:hypothetical protein